MKLNMPTPFNEGDPILVQVWDHKSGSAQWHPGTFLTARSAVDRDWRGDVRLDDGREFSDAAPECIVDDKRAKRLN